MVPFHPMLAKVHITLKNGVLDPQGKAIHSALNQLGFEGVSNVNLGKYLEITLDTMPEMEAKKKVREMCEKLLANTVIESYQITLVP